MGYCRSGYFQVLTVMKPEGFQGLSLLNNLGDLCFENMPVEHLRGRVPSTALIVP